MKLKRLILLVSFLLVLGACSRNLDNEKFIGPPSLVNISTSVGFSTTTANFQNNSIVYYYTKFNQPTYWSIKIRGSKSGAVKQFSGYGTTIDITNSAWRGNTDSIYFFQEGEKCSGTLLVSGISNPISIDSILIEKPRQFPTDRYYIINDFNDVLRDYTPIKYGGDTNNIKTKKVFIQPQNCGVIEVDSFNYISSLNIFNSSDAVKPVEGTGIGVLEGDLSTIPGKYLIGGIYMNGIGLSNFPNANPDSIFLNIVAKSAPAPYQGKLTLQISETETLNNSDPCTYPNSTGDVWAFDTPVLTTNWEVYSIRYSQLALGFKCNGNFKRDPQNLTQANINVVVGSAGGKAKIYVDFYVITYGKPLQP